MVQEEASWPPELVFLQTFIVGSFSDNFVNYSDWENASI